MSHNTLCGEFLLHAPCYFMWGASLTRPVLLYFGSFSYTPRTPILFGGGGGGFFYTPRTTLCGEFLLHALCYCSGWTWGVLLHAPCSFMCGVFSYAERYFIREFLLHAPCYFMRGLSLTRPSLLSPEDRQTNARTSSAE